MREWRQSPLGDESLSAADASWILHHWWQQRILEEPSRRTSKQHSKKNAILNKRSGWTYAARAILEYGLPQLELETLDDEVTGRIRAMGSFATNMAVWLQKFAQGLIEHRETDKYKQDVIASSKPSTFARRDTSQSTGTWCTACWSAGQWHGDEWHRRKWH